MNDHKQKLELTWIGKNEELRLEPRILIEDPDKSYGDVESENLLIHGDNLLALKALQQDFASRVKCVYIDPPYNTGKAFDKYDDGIEHSIWLNLMRPRIELLHSLLATDGIVWISLDDVEVHYMKILCDEVFGRNNFIASLPTIMNLKGNNDEFGFAGTHEYTLVYAKDISTAKIGMYEIDEEEMEDWEKDDIGFFKRGANLKATGTNAPREKRPNLYYPLYVSEDNTVSITRQSASDVEILPITDGKEMSWRWSKDKVTNEPYNIIIVRNGDNVSVYKKQRPEIGELPSKKPKTLFYKPEYSSGNGTSQLKRLFGEVVSVFPYPKPEELIADFIKLTTSPGDIILDSFLGSGTTAAVATKLGRKWIGVEMGDHSYTLCVPRLRLVIDGKDDGGISKKVNWKGGGGFKFYNLAPSLLRKDGFGNFVIDEKYNANMLAAAVCKHEGFKYFPDETLYWKQGRSTEADYIFVTTGFVTVEQLDKIHAEMKEGESLLICAKAYASGCENHCGNITVKKIPQMILGKCEFGKDNYDLNIIKATEAEAEEAEMAQVIEMSDEQ